MPARHHQHLARLGAAAVLALGGLSAATASAAADVPDPLSSTVARVTEGLSGAPEPVGDVGSVIVDTAEPLLGGEEPAEESDQPPAEEHTPAEAQEGSEGQTAPASAPEPERSSPSTPVGEPSGAPGGSVQATTPAGTVCIIPATGSSPAFEIDLVAAGVDLSSPMVEQLPQVFAACPDGAVPADEETVTVVDAVLDGLLGACIRVTRSVAPLQTTLVVLDHNLIQDLTSAGLPLQQLVVPCPAVGDVGDPAAPGSSSAASTGTPAATSQAASAAPVLPSRLAFTGANPGPLLAIGTGLLTVGVLLSRRACLTARP